MMRDVWIVALFTFRNKIRTKAFVVSTIILALLISAGINMPYIISRLSANHPTKVAMIQGESTVAPLLQQYYSLQKSPSVVIVMLPDQGSQAANEKELESAVTSKKVRGFIEFGSGTTSNGLPPMTYKSTESMSSSDNVVSDLEGALQSIKTQLVVKQIGLTRAQLQELYAPVTVQSVQLSTAAGQHARSSNAVIITSIAVYAFLFLLFMSVNISATMIANEITAEKNSRVMEILISTISPIRQMFGKIMGVGLVSFSQIVFFVVVTGLNLLMPQNIGTLQQNHLSLRDVPPDLFVFFLIFYLTGFFLYSTVFAAIGSMVSRTEDLGQAIMPVTFFLLAGFYIGMYGLRNPSATIITIGSLFPFYTPFLMFLRIGLTDVPAWQVGVSLVELAVSVYAITWLAAKIYRTGVLMYGKRPSVRELVKAMKAMKV